jgi:flagellar motor switch protein FliN/FliY
MTDKAREIEFLYDVELELSVVLGTSRMLIRELLQLQSGSVVELSKLAGESLDVVINDKVIARGEAVVVNEKFGIRLTEVVSPFERVQHLRD